MAGAGSLGFAAAPFAAFFGGLPTETPALCSLLPKDGGRPAPAPTPFRKGE